MIINNITKAISLYNPNWRSSSITTNYDSSGKYNMKFLLILPSQSADNTMSIAHYMRGKLYLDRGDETAALPDFEASAQAEHGDFADPHYFLWLLYQNAQPEKAEEEKAKAFDKNRTFKFIEAPIFTSSKIVNPIKNFGRK